VEEHGCSTAGKLAGKRATKTVGRAGDEDDLPVDELESASCTVIAIVGAEDDSELDGEYR
jgi:hypothetical protein